MANCTGCLVGYAYRSTRRGPEPRQVPLTPCRPGRPARQQQVCPRTSPRRRSARRLRRGRIVDDRDGRSRTMSSAVSCSGPAPSGPGSARPAPASRGCRRHFVTDDVGVDCVRYRVGCPDVRSSSRTIEDSTGHSHRVYIRRGPISPLGPMTFTQCPLKQTRRSTTAGTRRSRQSSVSAARRQGSTQMGYVVCVRRAARSTNPPASNSEPAITAIGVVGAPVSGS